MLVQLSLGQYLKLVRNTVRGRTLNKVGAAIGYSGTALGDLEKGVTKEPSARMLIKLAKLYNLDPLELFKILIEKESEECQKP